MERKLATIRKISDIRAIKDADNIELAKIDGWQVVIAKKDNFKIGDLCIYCEIDSVLPDIPAFEFLRSKKFRIKTVKLKGELSQGIVFPISLLSEFSYFGLIEEGTDITDSLGIIKYEAPIITELSGIAKGDFPVLIPKTDEERCQNILGMLDKYKNQEIEFVATEKLDGTSVTYAIINNEFNVCSRNLNLEKDEKNTIWKFAIENDIENKLRKYIGEDSISIAIQGELIGEGIQKNNYNIKGHKVYFFNVFDIDKQKYLDFDESKNLLDYLGLSMVPVFLSKFYLQDITIEDLIKLADGNSQLNVNSKREGIVFKSKYSINYPYGKVSFKVISNKYLLKNE